MKTTLISIMFASVFVQTTLPNFVDENELKDEINNSNFNQFLDENKDLRKNFICLRNIKERERIYL